MNGIEDTVDLAGTPLRRPERINLAMVILISQVLQILLVTLLVWLFFAAFGALLVDVKLGETWVGAEANQLFDFSLFGEKVVVTDQLLRSSFGIAAFSGLERIRFTSPHPIGFKQDLVEAFARLPKVMCIAPS